MFQRRPENPAEWARRARVNAELAEAIDMLAALDEAGIIGDPPAGFFADRAA